MKKKFLFLNCFLFILATINGYAQLNSNNPMGSATSGLITLTGTNNIINSYHPVSSFSTTLSSFSPNASSLFFGKRVLLIQMIGTSPSSISGTCEWITVNATGDWFTTTPLNSYNTSGNNRVQLVLVPQYYDLTIDINASLTCDPWNGNTGGVLVFNVKNNFINNGLCDVRGKGFQGGAGGTGGVGGAGGTGGAGGAINMPGANGSNTGTAYPGI